MQDTLDITGVGY